MDSVLVMQVEVHNALFFNSCGHGIKRMQMVLVMVFLIL